MASVSQLADQAEAELDFLCCDGWSRTARELVAPHDFRGGFILRYGKQRHELIVKYLDTEFEVRLDGAETFGASVHPDFSGNQFSREHLREHLPHLARLVARHAHLQ